MRSALWLSVKVGLLATGIALVLGTMAAFAIHRFRFFGRESVSFLLLLPIALPGIITGMALNSFYVFAGVGFSIWTIVIGHATFCIVVVYNNVLARLRRTSASLLEASMDLGADGWQTFRFIVWPVLSTALVAGGLLAFALSFDEVIVTTFTAGAQETLPIFILDNIRRGQQLPIVNVVAFVVILLTVVPVALAQRLTRDTGIAEAGHGRKHDHQEGGEMGVTTQYKNLIGGEWVDAASGETMDVIEPATGEMIAEVPRCDAEDVDRAVEAAEAGAPEWLEKTPKERSELLTSSRTCWTSTPRSSRSSSRATSASRSWLRATRCRSRPTTSASSRAPPATSRASRPASTSRATPP